MKIDKLFLAGIFFLMANAHAAMAQTNQTPNSAPTQAPTPFDMGENYLKHMTSLAMPEIYLIQLSQKCGVRSKAYADSFTELWWKVVIGGAGAVMYTHGYKGQPPDKQLRPIFNEALKNTQASVQKASDEACNIFKYSNVSQVLDDAFSFNNQ